MKTVIMGKREFLIICLCMVLFGWLLGGLQQSHAIRKTLKIRQSVHIDNLKEKISELEELTVVLRPAKGGE